MAENRQSPAGGGIFIALGVAAGVTIGRHFGQTSIGVIAGLVIGMALATLIWWRSRGR